MELMIGLLFIGGSVIAIALSAILNTIKKHEKAIVNLSVTQDVLVKIAEQNLVAFDLIAQRIEEIEKNANR